MAASLEMAASAHTFGDPRFPWSNYAGARSYSAEEKIWVQELLSALS